MSKAATSLGLTHEKFYSRPDSKGGRLYLGDLVGEAKAVATKAAELQVEAEEEERQANAQSADRS